jgi:hypothetical protein
MEPTRPVMVALDRAAGIVLCQHVPVGELFDLGSRR